MNVFDAEKIKSLRLHNKATAAFTIADWMVRDDRITVTHRRVDGEDYFYNRYNNLGKSCDDIFHHCVKFDSKQIVSMGLVDTQTWKCKQCDQEVPAVIKLNFQLS